jgi:2-methylisocitrate lyase-like PEP mutase family enzyme
LLDAAQCDGTVRAVLQPSITWADLIATARTDPRIAIAAAAPNLDAAIARALAILTSLGPGHVDVEVTLTPDQLTLVCAGFSPNR